MGLVFNWRNPKDAPAKGVDPAVGGSAGYHAPFGPRHEPVQPFMLHFTRHAQPDPGMAAVSYDLLQLPVYTPIGSGIQNRRQWKTFPSNPVVQQRQGLQITTVGNPGYLAGSFVATPLIDTRSPSAQANDGPAANAIPSPGEFNFPRGPF